MPGFYYADNYFVISVQLKPHPSTPASMVRGVNVEISRAADILALRYCLTGKLAALCIPQPGPPQRTDNLWQHCCFEIFIRQTQQTAYDEYNFSPSRQWAHYHFNDYRAGESQPDTPAPQITVLQQPNQLSLITHITIPTGLVQINLSTVLEDENGNLSYWALHHPLEKADFHHSDAFILELE
jgi:hypothetical protein